MLKYLSSLTLITSLSLIALEVDARPLALNVTMQCQERESYSQFLQRASTLAQKTISQSFQKHGGVESVNLVVIGENDGAIAPVLGVKVSRSDWQSSPQIERWSSEFPFSKSLLGFENPPPPPVTPSSPSPVTPSSPSPVTSSSPPPTAPGYLPGDELPEAEPEPIPLPDQRLRVTPRFREQREQELNGQ